MSLWRIGICLFLLLLLQTSFLPFVELPLARPDLLLLLTIYVGLASRPEKATITGFVAGVVQDAFTGKVFGLNAFAKSLAGFLGPALRRSFMVTSFFVQLLTVALLSVVHAMTLYWMGAAVQPGGHPTGTADFFSSEVLPATLSNLIFWILLRPILRWVIPPPEERSDLWRRGY